MSLFTERLKELRTAKKLSQKGVSEGVGIAYRNYQHYEYGEREPSMGKLIDLANFFDVSIDYLVGRTDNPKINH